MAIGMGKMLGFKFPENFNSPYTSISITQFWRKWHITLGRFMRDYLYKPLGGSFVGTSKTYRNLLIVFLLSGLWHGASWNFVLWGAYHGAFLIIERITGLAKSKKIPLVRTCITFIIVVLGWVVFRIEQTSEALSFYAALFSFDGITPIYCYNNKLLFVLGVALFFGFLSATKLGKQWQDHFYKQEFTKRSLITYFGVAVVLFSLSVASLSTGSYNPFIYFRF